MSIDWKLVKDSFNAALDLGVAGRESFLAALDEPIAREVRELLGAHDALDDFIDVPVPVGIGISPESLVGTEIDAYKLVAVVGTGGMGSVFRAEKRDVGRGFALKLIKRGMDSEAVVRRFALERTILSRLDHPNIARLLDGGTTVDGLPFFVMEFVEGIPLTRFCRENGSDLKARLRLFLGICDAVSYAHRNLVVHRDLKPSNILVTADGTPKLLDFGIAKLLDADDSADEVTATQARALTPDYASPEQILGRHVTTASDVFSLGVVLYELLTGRRPFATVGSESVAERVVSNDPARPSTIIGRVDESRGMSIQSGEIGSDLDNIVLKALRKEPERRYGSVVEMAEDIERFLDGRPVSATGDGRRYRFFKFVSRHRAGVIGTTLAASLLLAVSAVAVRQGIVATRERGKAEKRLTDIRVVAKSLITETNDSLARVPGNVATQRMLAEKSVALLDSLDIEEGADAELETELADAYVKLAEIENRSFRDFDKAVVSLEKAESIYRRFLGRGGDEVGLRRKIYTAQLRHVESLLNTGRREEMFRVGEAAIENLREITRLAPEVATNFVDLAAMHGWFGDKYAFFGRPDDAVSSYAEGLAIADKAIEVRERRLEGASDRAELARILLIKGWLANGAGNPADGIENYRRAAVAAKREFAADPTVSGNFIRVVGGYEGIAEISVRRNDFATALDAYREAFEFASSLTDERTGPTYLRVSSYRCFCTVSAGKAAAKLGRVSDAAEFFGLGRRICRASVEQDAGDSSKLFEHLPFLYDIAEYLASTGRGAEARKELDDVESRIASVIDRNPDDFAAALALAETYEKIGDVDASARPSFYEKSVELWREQVAKARLVPDEQQKFDRVAAKLVGRKPDQ